MVCVSRMKLSQVGKALSGTNTAVVACVLMNMWISEKSCESYYIKHYYVVGYLLVYTIILMCVSNDD